MKVWSWDKSRQWTVPAPCLQPIVVCLITSTTCIGPITPKWLELSAIFHNINSDRGLGRDQYRPCPCVRSIFATFINRMGSPISTMCNWVGNYSFRSLFTFCCNRNFVLFNHTFANTNYRFFCCPARFSVSVWFEPKQILVWYPRIRGSRASENPLGEKFPIYQWKVTSMRQSFGHHKHEAATSF